MCVQIYNAILLSISSALPAPDVSISVSGDSIAGQSYSLQCSASVVHGVVVQPDLEIVGPDGSVLASVGQSVTLTHMFSSLATSNGGQYTCTATLNIPEANITNLQGSAVEDIDVVGMLLHVMHGS